MQKELLLYVSPSMPVSRTPTAVATHDGPPAPLGDALVRADGAARPEGVVQPAEYKRPHEAAEAADGVDNGDGDVSTLPLCHRCVVERPERAHAHTVAQLRQHELQHHRDRRAALRRRGARGSGKEGGAAAEEQQHGEGVRAPAPREAARARRAARQPLERCGAERREDELKRRYGGSGGPDEPERRGGWQHLAHDPGQEEHAEVGDRGAHKVLHRQHPRAGPARHAAQCR
eukprot:scaffold90838_cov54-Phaeocystis_antarctica.AAC.1